MKLLVDSHILIWLLYEPEKIQAPVRESLGSADEVYISVVSLWELTLKYTKHKLAYPPDQLTKGVQALNLEILPIRDKHLLVFPRVELPHSDPFDVLLVAQSEVEGCKLLTADSHLLRSKYRTVSAEAIDLTP